MRTALALLTLAASACSALDDFEVTIHDEAIIDAAQPQGALTPVSFAGDLSGLDLSTTKSFSDRGVEASDVDHVYLKSVEIYFENESFRIDPIIDTIEIFVEASGQAKQKIASKTFPAGTEVTRAMLDVMSTIDLKPYAVAKSMTLSANLSLKQRPFATMVLKIDVVLNVDANIAGV